METEHDKCITRKLCNISASDMEDLLKMILFDTMIENSTTHIRKNDENSFSVHESGTIPHHDIKNENRWTFKEYETWMIIFGCRRCKPNQLPT